MKKQIVAFFLGLLTFISTINFAHAADYVVQKGDTLWGISQKEKVTVNQIKDWNQLTNDLIYPGDRLSLESSKQAEQASKEKSSQEIQVTATAYTAYCSGCSGTTATGINLRSNPDQKVIAVDPNIIPLGSKVWVEGYGEAIAGDTGGAIKGNKIDVFVPTKKEATNWGVKKVKIKVLS